MANFLIFWFVFIFVFTSLNAKSIQLRQFLRLTTSNSEDWEFGGTFYIGKNYFAQQVSVAFDLESPYTILYDLNYVKTNKWPQSSLYDYFNSTDSFSFSTQNVPLALDYSQDSQDIKTKVEGIWGNDLVIFGFEDSTKRRQKIYSFNATFGLIQSGNHFSPSNANFAFTGRLGMSLNGTEENWVVRAIKKQYDGIVTFAVSGGIYYLGLGSTYVSNCDSKAKFTEKVVKTNEQVGKQKWQIKTNGFEYGKYTYDEPQYVSFTLSTFQIVAPQDYFTTIKKQLGAYEEAGRFVVDCAKISKSPKLSFELSSGILEIPPANYITQDANDENCYLRIRPSTDSENSDLWAFGSLFQRAFCTSLDYKNEQIVFQPVKT